MPTVTVHTTPTSYRLVTTHSLYIPNTPINLYHHLRPFNELKWDYQQKRMVPKKHYYFRNEDDGMTFIPRYDLPRFVNMVESRGGRVKTREVPLEWGKKIDIPLADWYKPRDQTQVDALDYAVHNDNPMRCLALQPGCGKTSIGIVSSSRIGRRVLIKTPILVNQWIGAIKKFTKLEDDDIYVISGSASLARLISEIDKTIFPKIILAAVQTMRAYAQRDAPYHIFPRIEDFCNLCDIGIVVSDEVHLFFHTGLMLDMMLNPRVMIPMSATYEVTDRQIEPIFNGHFPPNLRFGEDRYERYVIVTSYTFDIPSNKIAKSQYRTFSGYNHTLYEKDLLKKKPVIDRIIRDVYYPILEMEYFSYAQPGERLLIICARTEMCAYMVKILKRDYPDKKVALFIAGTPESVKSENDIIVSTVKSAGVGFDVPNLITTFVTVAADSPPLNKQLLGRLRKVEGRDPRLAYVTCRQLESHRKYTQTRRMVFPPLAKEFHAHHL